MICKTNVMLHIRIFSFPLLTGLSSPYVRKYSPINVELSLCKTRRHMGNQVAAPLIRNLRNTRNADSVESSALTYRSLDRQDVIPTAWTPRDAMGPSEKRKTSCPYRKTKIPQFPRPQTNQDIDLSHSGSHNKRVFSYDIKDNAKQNGKYRVIYYLVSQVFIDAVSTTDAW